MVYEGLLDELFGLPRAEPAGNFRVVVVLPSDFAVSEHVAVEKGPLAVEQPFLALEDAGGEVVVLDQIADHDGHVVARAIRDNTFAHHVLVSVFPIRVPRCVENRGIAACADTC